MRMNKRDKTALVPRLRFPEFKNNHIISFKNGNVIFESISNKNHNSNLPVLAITQEYGAIPRDQIDYNVSVTEKSLKSYKVVEIGDYIISLRSFQGGIEYSLYHGICSPAYIILRKKVPIVEQYYKYYFKTNKFIQDLNKDLEGIRDGKMVSYSQFSSILLPKPENTEQKKIAECLSSLDDLITEEDKKLEALKVHKKGLMQKLFPSQGKSIPEWRFPEFRGKEEWEVKSLGSMTIKIGSGTTPLGGEANYKKRGRPFIRSQNVGWGYLILDDIAYIDESTHQESISTEVFSGDTLLNITGASIGRSAVANYLVNGGNVNQHVCIIRTITDVLSPWFLNQYFLSVYGQMQIESFQAGGNRLGLNFNQIRSFCVPIPSRIEEQHKIADCLTSLDDLVAVQNSKINILKKHKKGLMQGLFPSIEETNE